MKIELRRNDWWDWDEHGLWNVYVVWTGDLRAMLLPIEVGMAPSPYWWYLKNGEIMESSLYERAKWFAGVAHCKQKYGTHDYTYHLEQVEMALNRFGFVDNFQLRISAWLHDVIEDTKISYDQIKLGFGQEIADVVYAVTNEMGRNRQERHEKTYAKIRQSKEALALKLADRIANIEFSKGTDSGFFQMYEKEWKGFHSALFDPEETDARINKMWRYLEDLFDENEDK